MNAYKNRKLNQEEPVRVYRNLNDDCLSLKQKTHVVGHTHFVMLSDVSFIVGEKARDRVRTEKRKGVHAYVEGLFKQSKPYIRHIEKTYQVYDESDEWERVYYNPYKTDTFVIYSTNEPIFKADKAIVIMDRVYVKSKK